MLHCPRISTLITKLIKYGGRFLPTNSMPLLQEENIYQGISRRSFSAKRCFWQIRVLSPNWWLKGQLSQNCCKASRLWWWPRYQISPAIWSQVAPSSIIYKCFADKSHLLINSPMIGVNQKFDQNEMEKTWKLPSNSCTVKTEKYSTQTRWQHTASETKQP